MKILAVADVESFTIRPLQSQQRTKSDRLVRRSFFSAIQS